MKRKVTPRKEKNLKNRPVKATLSILKTNLEIEIELN